jgi:hypothetical protein
LPVVVVVVVVIVVMFIDTTTKKRVVPTRCRMLLVGRSQQYKFTTVNDLQELLATTPRLK